MGEVVVRRLPKAEWEAWANLRLRALAGDPDGMGSASPRDDPYWDEAWRERMGSLAVGADRVMLVAEDEGVAVGCGGAFIDDDGSAAIVSMWTAPAHRGRGIAMEVLRAIESWAEERGCHRLVLQVVEGNRPAESLYGQAGFQRTGAAVPLDSDPNVRMLEMERRLPRTSR